MKTRLVLKAGDKGTRKVVREFGDRLICVRYRYDEVARRRLKTAEIILEEVPWDPGSKRRAQGGEELVKIRVLRSERELQALVKEAGARWLPYDRLWALELEAVERLGLEDRIVAAR